MTKNPEIISDDNKIINSFNGSSVHAISSSNTSSINLLLRLNHKHHTSGRTCWSEQWLSATNFAVMVLEMSEMLIEVSLY
jgi:hypothetical protein